MPNTARAQSTGSRPLQGLEDALTTVTQYAEEFERAPKGRSFKKADLESVRARLNQALESFNRSSAKRPRAIKATDQSDDLVDVTFEHLLADGQLLSTAAFLAGMGWTKQALSKATAKQRVFYVEVKGSRAYPAFYLDPRYNRKQLEEVTKLLGGLSGGSKWMFFSSSKGSLATAAKDGQSNGMPRTPLQALEAGDLERVRRAAVGFAER